MIIPTVGKDRRRTRMVYGRPGRDEGVRGHDDLVPPADPRRQQCDQETVGTVADTESMLDTEVPREICLELVEFFLQDKPARREHSVDRAHDLLALSREERRVVEEWNRPDLGSVHEHQPS